MPFPSKWSLPLTFSNQNFNKSNGSCKFIYTVLHNPAFIPYPPIINYGNYKH
jgi:hypothetical protein